jgi:flagellar basal-body rod protein FlgB
MFQNSMFDQESMPTLSRAIAFTESRQRTIAQNIANAETPNYQAKDLSEARFNLRLKEAIFNRRYDNPRYYDFRDDPEMNDDSGFLEVRPYDNSIGIMKHSQNNVDIDVENSKMAKNAMFHKTLVELLSSQYSKLGSAIRGSF